MTLNVRSGIWSMLASSRITSCLAPRVRTHARGRQTRAAAGRAGPARSRLGADHGGVRKDGPITAARVRGGRVRFDRGKDSRYRASPRRSVRAQFGHTAYLGCLTAKAPVRPRMTGSVSPKKISPRKRMRPFHGLSCSQRYPASRDSHLLQGRIDCPLRSRYQEQRISSFLIFPSENFAFEPIGPKGLFLHPFNPTTASEDFRKARFVVGS